MYEVSNWSSTLDVAYIEWAGQTNLMLENAVSICRYSPLAWMEFCSSFQQGIAKAKIYAVVRSLSLYKVFGTEP